MKRCKELVWNAALRRSRPCNKKADEESGLCKQHDPRERKKKLQTRESFWENENRRRQAERAAPGLIKRIAEGYAGREEAQEFCRKYPFT